MQVLGSGFAVPQQIRDPRLVVHRLKLRRMGLDGTQADEPFVAAVCDRLGLTATFKDDRKSGQLVERTRLRQETKKQLTITNQA